MQRRLTSICSLILLALSLCLPASHSAYANSPTSNAQRSALADFPTVDPNYIYDQLFFLATNFQHREAGYDNISSVKMNGHDAFAAYWSQEMQKNLAGFGPRVRRDQFPVNGWVGRPATAPAFNVEISVPGVTHPEQVVVIGCHYDGEAISTQSANDDASGCAIELGVAKAMGTYWRNHHTYPVRTLRFVIFDAEEQGLYGSFHYLNNTINGDISNIVAMFNEEQNGIAYPLRFLGKMSYPLLPFNVNMSPLLDSQLYPHQDRLSAQQQHNITHFRALMQQAMPVVFAQFQALGFQAITYHGDNNQDVSQPVFSSDQMNNIHLRDDDLGGSDQIPFTLAGLPCATLVGNATYYDTNPPPWSYPFDQKQDTIQLMNTFASGGSKKAPALVLALAIPGMLTTWMLNQPDILGQSSAGTLPIAAISDIGQAKVNQSLSLDASAAYVPNDSNVALNYGWNFGDDATASGVSVNHTYTRPGTYTLILTVSSSTGTLHISKTIHVVTQPTSYDNPYAKYQADGVPPSNPAVLLPMPDDTPAGQVSTTPVPTPSATPSHNSTGLFIGIGIVLIIVALVIIVILLRVRQNEKSV